MRSFIFSLAACAAFAAANSGTLQAGSISVYLSPAGSETSNVSFAGGVTPVTETFNGPSGSYTQYSSVLGTYTGNMQIQSADSYGGANGSNYMTFGAQNGSSGNVTLALKTPANYFGVWWSAADANNGISLFSSGTQLIRISQSEIYSLAATTPAANQSLLQNSAANYYCNPNNTSQDCGEAFAYLNIFASGVTFDKIVFDNSGSSGTGFESDNHTVAYGTPVSQNSMLLVGSQAVPTPEPGSISMVLGGSILVAWGVYRSRR